ncbi:MAG TPA: glycosyltransferase family 39 protein [Terriglobales bacterium]|nr:glycosyltransferase family 39 protein [Terriglobales bacterium]
MLRYFSRERFGFPQAIGALLLLAFIMQCLWFCAKAPLAESEVGYIHPQTVYWARGTDAPSIISPATHTLAALALNFTAQQAGESAWNRLILRFPFLLMATALAASLWYVSRRLFSNAGGYVAMILYVFSPWAVIYGATVQPGGPASWAVFGMVFTGIAVAHTLYAPREVVLRNWKRILLLGISIGLAVSSIFASVLLVPAAFCFVLYLAPHRRGAALTICAAACALGLLVAWILCEFDLRALLPDQNHMALHISPNLYGTWISYSLLGRFLTEMPSVLALLVAALVAFVAWPKTRYFSTTAPLMIFVLLLLLGIGMPHQGGIDFFRMALPFAYVFIAGVFADLLQTKWPELILAVLAAVLLTHAIFSVVGLAKM